MTVVSGAILQSNWNKTVIGHDSSKTFWMAWPPFCFQFLEMVLDTTLISVWWTALGSSCPPKGLPPSPTVRTDVPQGLVPLEWSHQFSRGASQIIWGSSLVLCAYIYTCDPPARNQSHCYSFTFWVQPFSKRGYRFWLFNGTSFSSLFYIRSVHLLHTQTVYKCHWSAFKTSNPFRKVLNEMCFFYLANSRNDTFGF